MYKLLTGTDDEYESGCDRNQCNRDSQLKGDHAAEQRVHMYMMVKMSDLFGFVNDLEKIMYRCRDISWCAPSIDPGEDNRIIVQKDLSKRKHIYFNYYEGKTFYKNVPNASNFLFDLGMKKGMERQQYTKIGFENNNVNEQTHDATTFDIMNVTECYCKIGSEFYPEELNFISNHKPY